ncbi:MAG: D-alanyl-D-alanine carboxypeptidase/D-alanyl-D-alanine-endopeptidase, partial [Myxococcales bacterium]
NVKLFSSAAALALLGSEYRFETEFLAEKPAVRGTPLLTPQGELKGNLFVRGKGDPSITNERLWGIVNELYHAGLRKVSGDLVLDDSYFDEELNGPGFDQERSDRSYMAPPAALSLNWNTVAIYVGPGESAGAKARVELEPQSDFFVVESRAVTGAPRQLRRVSASSLPAGNQQRIVVTGRVPVGQYTSAMWKKIDNPTFYFGHSLRQALELRGIKVKGKIRKGRAPDPAQALYVHHSEPLDLILKRVNKNSSNFTAEMLVKTLGAQFRGVPGSWISGIDVIEQFLAEQVGIPRGTYVMKNGSGLNDTNRFSAAQTCKLLRHMYARFPLQPEFLSSLGIAGKDGTLHSRMAGTDAVGNLRAKTGTLENVSALSGYVQTKGGERFVFSLMVNDFPGRTAPVVAGLDAIGASIAELGGPGGPAAGLAKAMGPPPKAGTEAELKARITTYETLAAMADPRNLTFLRTALRNEPDPALKALVADAMFRSDPEDGATARALLDTFDPGPDVLGRLRRVSKEMVLPTPLLGSLARIAAEGNGEALSRMVELAALARQDAGLAGELMDPLTEISRNAPDELIVTLKA